MISILVRTSYRPQGFSKLMASIDHPCNVIVCFDDDRALEYLNNYPFLTVFKVEKTGGRFDYNLYVNALVQAGTGHMIVVDDDDTLIPGSIAALDLLLQPGQSYIVPFMRGTLMKPTPAQINNKDIAIGWIGLPCLILWHEHKQFVQFDHTEEADYKAIKRLSRAVSLNWINLPIVSSPARGWGRMEG